MQRPSVSTAALAPTVPQVPSKVTILRRTTPFVLSGVAAVTELVLLSMDVTNKNATLAATVLWLAANVAGLTNLYLDYRYFL